jgi:hypothetical protein
MMDGVYVRRGEARQVVARRGARKACNKEANAKRRQLQQESNVEEKAKLTGRRLEEARRGRGERKFLKGKMKKKKRHRK